MFYRVGVDDEAECMQIHMRSVSEAYDESSGPLSNGRTPSLVAEDVLAGAHTTTAAAGDTQTQETDLLVPLLLSDSNCAGFYAIFYAAQTIALYSCGKLKLSLNEAVFKLLVWILANYSY